MNTITNIIKEVKADLKMSISNNERTINELKERIKSLEVTLKKLGITMKILYQLFLAFNSTWLIVVVFLVKEKYQFNILSDVSIYFSWILFVLVPIILTALSFLVALKLPLDSLKDTSVKEIELANNNFLPTYLGYFFVSLGVDDVPTLVVVFGIIYVFTSLSQTLYFNPIFLLFGYHFYFIKTSGNVKIFLITRRHLKTPGNDEFKELRRINNYTFIEL